MRLWAVRAASEQNAVFCPRVLSRASIAWPRFLRLAHRPHAPHLTLLLFIASLLLTGGVVLLWRQGRMACASNAICARPSVRVATLACQLLAAALLYLRHVYIWTPEQMSQPILEAALTCPECGAATGKRCRWTRVSTSMNARLVEHFCDRSPEIAAFSAPTARLPARRANRQNVVRVTGEGGWDIACLKVLSP